MMFKKKKFPQRGRNTEYEMKVNDNEEDILFRT